MEEQPDTSIQVPLIQREEPPSPEPQSTYLKTNFIDTYFLFWVGKLISVIPISPPLHIFKQNSLDRQEKAFPTRHALESS